MSPRVHREFDREAFRFCPNVTQGWENGIDGLLLHEKDKFRKILDVGCGNAGELLLEGPDIWGIDPNLGQMRFKGDGKDYGTIGVAVPERSVVGFAEDLPWNDEEFDIALSTKAVGWYPRQINTKMALEEMLRVTKKVSGYVVFNIGQEMTPAIINPILIDLHNRGYDIRVTGCWCLMFHREHKEATSQKMGRGDQSDSEITLN